MATKVKRGETNERSGKGSPAAPEYFWHCCKKRLPLSHGPLVMGILNVTPDSFSDGGLYNTPEAAFARAAQMVEEGADIIDVGGMSTRPGAAACPLKEEIARVAPVVEKIVSELRVPVSVDTYRPFVAKAALENGACIVNDVKPFADIVMAAVTSRAGAGIVAMHARGTPKTMDSLAHYDDVTAAVEKELKTELRFAEERGIEREQIVIDPGIGFAKTTKQNLQVLRDIGRLAKIAPVLIGASRKRFIGEICKEDVPEKRDAGTLACSIWVVCHGASVLRVHDVKGTCQALKMLKALCLKDSK